MEELGERTPEDPQYFDDQGRNLCTLIRCGAEYLNKHGYPYEDKHVIFAARTTILAHQLPEVPDCRFVV